MSTRDVRELLVEHWGGELRQLGVRDPFVIARRLADMAEAQGVSLTRPAHHHDPAASWQTPVTDPTPPTADWRQARAALKGDT
jgi:hypothetical protein